MNDLHKQHSASMTRLGEPLRRYQAAGLERLVRILHYLGRADDEQLRRVAMHCYRANIDEAELVSAAIERGLCDESECDQDHVRDVQITFDILMQLINDSDFQPPYATAACKSQQPIDIEVGLIQYCAQLAFGLTVEHKREPISLSALVALWS